MARIKGKFCPLTDELGNDERFLIQSTDLDKLMYILIMYTCHMTYHQAPNDPRYYIRRYGLSHRLTAVRHSLDKVLTIYQHLVCTNKKLSLLNSPTYRSQPVQKVLEVEEEVEENKNKNKNDLDIFNEILLKYPTKLGESRARQKFFTWNVSRGMFSRMIVAVDKYKSHLSANDWKKPMNFNTWLDEWTDWENHEEIETEDQKVKKLAKSLKEKL